jgi:hypothetical protein
MRVLLVLILGSAIALSGCAHQYVLTLTNGTRVTSSTKPRLERGNYYFKDIRGRDSFVPAGRVREVAPASMAEDETSKFKVPTGK